MQIFTKLFSYFVTSQWRHTIEFLIFKLAHAKLQSIIFRTLGRYFLYLVYFWRLRLWKIVGNSVWKTLNSDADGFMKEQYFRFYRTVFWKFKPISTSVCIEIRSIPKIKDSSVRAKFCKCPLTFSHTLWRHNDVITISFEFSNQPIPNFKALSFEWWVDIFSILYIFGD